MPVITIDLAVPRRPITVQVDEGTTMADARQQLLLRGDITPEDIGFQTATGAEGVGAMESAMIEAGQFVSTLPERVGTLFGDQQSTDALREAERQMQPLREDHPVATMLGSALPGFAIPGGLGVQAIAGIAEGALRLPEEPLLGAAFGAGGVAAGAGIAKFGGQALERAMTNRMANTGRRFNLTGRSEAVVARGQARQFAEAAGIPLTHAERADTAVSRFMDRMASTALGRRVAGPTKQRALNKVMARSIGIEDADALTGDVLNRAAVNYGTVFEEVANTVDNIPLTQSFSDNITKLETMASEITPNARGLQTLEQLRNLAATDSLSGKEYNRLRSQWSRLSRNEWKAGGAGDPITGEFIDEVISTMDSALAETSGDIAARIGDARTGWRQLAAMRKGNAISPDGNVNPLAMQASLERSYPGLELNRFSRGDIGAAQKANIAAQWFPPEASSRTAERSIASMQAGISAIDYLAFQNAPEALMRNAGREAVLQTELFVNDTADAITAFFGGDTDTE